MARDAVARAPSQCLSAHVMERHNNQKYVAMAHFSFSSLNQNQNLFHSKMSPSPTSLNDACPAVSPTIFLNDASSSDEEEEQRCEEEGNVFRILSLYRGIFTIASISTIKTQPQL